MSLNANAFRFLPLPTDLYFGHGTLAHLPERVAELEAGRVFLVTDAGLRGVGLVDRVEAVLRDADLEVETYDGVEPDSGAGLIEEATERLKEAGSKLVVGLGGGSSLDTAKAVALLATADRPLLDYLGLGKVRHQPLPMIAVPTTAGTGSEVSLWSVFTDDRDRRKVAIGGVPVYPTVALCDPDLTLGLPPDLTAATGLDALTHATECYTSTACQPISAALALEAIALIGRHLRTAVLDGRDRAARHGMMLASTMAGMAMNPTRLGNAHALAMPLGSWDLKIPHGVANAVTLPHVMEFNHLARPERFAQVARALGEPVDGLSPRQAAARSVEAVRTLAADVGLSTGLGAYGLTREHVPRVVEEAMKSGNIAVNPRRTRPEDLRRILEAAL